METYAINHSKKTVIFYQEHKLTQWYFEMNLTDAQYDRMKQYINK